MTVALSLTPPPTATATAREEAAVARREARLADSRQALQTLKQARAAPKADQKAMALQKIARLKEQIKMLQMTASGDPARTAKVAAQLARELASAIKAYAASGGSAADVGATPSVRPTAVSSPETEPTTASTDVAASPEKAVAASPKVSGVDGDEIDTKDPDAKDPDAKMDAEKNPYRQAAETAQQRVNDQARRAGEARGDAEFLNQVKALASQLKQIIRQAAQRTAQAAEANGEPTPSPEARDAERALAAVEKEIEAATRSLSSGGGVSFLA